MDFIYQFISEDLIYALGWTVIHSLWQALIIGVLVAFAMMYLKNRSAKVRYEVAAFSQFMVFIAALSTFLIYYEGGLQLEKFSHLTAVEIQQLAALSQEGLFTKSTLQLFVEFFNNHIPAVVFVWMLGATFFLARMLCGLLYVQRLRYTNNQPVPAYWNGKLKALKSRIRLRKKVKLVESAIATVPMVIGYIKPVILLPIGAINNLHENEVEAILAHELAHIQRNDYLINILLSIIEVLFYFNPAVWWIAANIRAERENCCDDVAVKLCGSSLTYAKALVSLQEIGRSAPAMAMTFSGPKNQLLQRVKRILNQPQNKSNIMEKMTATLLLLLTVALFSVGANSNYDYNAGLNQEIPEMVESVKPSTEQTPKTVKLESLKVAPLPEPKRKTERKRYINNTDEGRVEIEIEDGTIVKISVNNKMVPPNQFGRYGNLIDEMLIDMNMIPANTFTADHSAGVPAFQHKKTIKKQRGGQTHMVIESKGQQNTEIVFEGKNQSFVIDGTQFEDGDTVIIVERRTSPQFNRHQELAETDNFMAAIADTENLSWTNKKNLEDKLSEIEAAFQRWEYTFNDRWEELEKNWEKLEQLNIKLWNNQSDANIAELMQKQEILNLRKKELERKKDRYAAAQHQWYREHNKEKEQIIRQLKEAPKANIAPSSCNSNKKKKQSSCKQSAAKIQEQDNAAAPNRFKAYGDGFLKFNNQLKRRLENELLKDRLILSKDDYSFELNSDRLKINGRKQSIRYFSKYIGLYQELTGNEMLGNSQVIIKNLNGQTQTNYHTSNFPEMEINKSFSCFSNSEGTYFFTATDSLDQENEILLATVELPNMIELTEYFEPNLDDSETMHQPLMIFLKECKDSSK